MDDQQNFGQRQMFQGEWECADCGAQITQLPFQPDGRQPIYCRDCFQKQRQNRPQRERRMIQGNWKCAGCGVEITQLPFEPRGDQPIYCRDCYMSQKQNR